jgi:hypothetical protein
VSWKDKWQVAYNQAKTESQKSRPVQPRSPQGTEINSWFEAANRRESTPPRRTDIDQLQAYLKAKNPVRWRRLQRDFKWAGSTIQKLGMNPEDARWLL